MRKYLPCLLALSLAFAFTTSATAQKEKPTKRPDLPAEKASDKVAAGQPSEAEMAKMMEAWKNAATPGEAHAKLKPLAGNWTFVTKVRMAAEEPWQESTGKAEYHWILGGRILAQEIKGNAGGSMDAMMGYPFEGFGLTGYDNVTKQYWNAWTDNMGTGLMTSTGAVDGSGKTFTYTGSYEDPILGKKTVKSVLKIAGDDKLVFEMYDKGPHGKEFVSLEVTYTRVK